ncbi:MAG: hypothetical protein ABIP94_02100 [Planctomycetota bacterium]
MKTLPMCVVRLGLLFLGAAAVLAGHEQLSKQWIDQFPDSRAACRLASVAASMAVWLMTGVFVLPMLRRVLRAPRSAHAANVVIGSALFVVSARAAVEAGTGVELVGLPMLSIAAVLAMLGGRSLLPTRSAAVAHGLRYVAKPSPQFIMPSPLPRAS